MTSIRHRLLLWLSIAVLAAAAGAAALSYVALEAEVTDLFDDHMVNLAQSLRNESDLNFSPPATMPRGREEDVEDDDFIIEVFDRSGTLISTSVAPIKIPLAVRSGFGRVDWQKESWRVYVLPMSDRIIMIAQRAGARDEVRAGVAMRILWPILGLIPVLGFLIWIVVGRSLRPLVSIRSALDTRTSASLDPLPEGRLPREIKPLVVAINDLMGRLRRALEAQRQFIADAAHELRTPLAAVDLQAQLVDRSVSESDRRSAMDRLRSGLRRATHVVEQLLTMARLEPDWLQAPQGPLLLDALAKQGISDFAQVAEAKRIDLGIVSTESGPIAGDREELRILIANLLDNAIRYTLEGGKVDVSVLRGDGTVALEVADSGPGIPESDRERVFDRFYRRSGGQAPGSGLGLAIVKRIVEQHRAQISLGPGLNRRGLRVTVRFPSAGLPAPAPLLPHAPDPGTASEPRPEPQRP